jgi:tetratricopeptide (TPR) repeat protein
MIKTGRENYLRMVLVAMVVVFLGLTPWPQSASRDLVRASHSLAGGDLLSASQSLASAGKFFPWRYELNIQAGRLAIQAEEPHAAIQYFERPGTLSHLSYEDKILLGDAYYQAGELVVAEALWTHLSDSNPTSQVYERLANLFLERGDYTATAEALERLLTLTPSDIWLYYQVGSLYAATEPLRALPFLAQAAEIDPENAANARELHDRIRTASLFDDPAYSLVIAGRQVASSGDWQLAVAAFQNATRQRPDYADAWAFLGEARGHLAVAETGSVSVAGFFELNRAIQLDPSSILANTFMGLYWERQEEYSLAQSYLDNAIQLSQQDPYLYVELGSLLSKAGEIPAALTAYQAAIQLAPQDPLFPRLLAEFALQNQIQLRQLALPAARQAVMLDPTEPASLDVMAQVMLALLDYQSAERYALNALQTDPGYLPAYLHLGTAYLYQGESDLARQWLEKAQEKDPSSWVSAQAKRMLEYYFP